MDLQFIINVVLPIILVVAGWFLKEMWNAVQSLKEDVTELRNHLSDNYVRKDDFASRWDEVLKAVHRIEDKLDRITESK